MERRKRAWEGQIKGEGRQGRKYTKGSCDGKEKEKGNEKRAQRNEQGRGGGGGRLKRRAKKKVGR